jgi:hypothetical protein
MSGARICTRLGRQRRYEYPYMYAHRFSALNKRMRVCVWDFVGVYVLRMKLCVLCVRVFVYVCVCVCVCVCVRVVRMCYVYVYVLWNGGVKANEVSLKGLVTIYEWKARG